MRIRMGIITKVFAQIKSSARTPREIAERSGVSITKVNEVLKFLEEFGLVESNGRRFKASRDITALP